MSRNIQYPNQIDTSAAEFCRADYPGTKYRSDYSKLLRFESPEDYADYLDTVPSKHHAHEWADNDRSSAKWHNATANLRKGDISKVEAAERVMDKLNEEQVFSLGMPTPHLDVVGALTHWQSYEAGLPNCMISRRSSDMRGANTPLTVYYDRFGSASLSKQHLINRGIACLAFVLAMSAIRPVNLYAIAVTAHGGRGGQFPAGSLYGSIIRIETQPLDLLRAAHMLTDEDFTRRLTWGSMSYLTAQHLGIADQYYSAYGPFVSIPSDGASYSQSMRHAFQLQPDDVLLLGASSLDQLAITDPVAWVKKMIQKHVYGEEMYNEPINT